MRSYNNNIITIHRNNYRNFQRTFSAARASLIILEYLGWLDCFFGFPDDFLFATFAGAAGAASDMKKLSSVDSHKAQKIWTSLRSVTTTNVEVEIKARPTTRVNKSKRADLVEAAAVARLIPSASCTCLRSVVFVWSNSRFNSVSRRYLSNFVSLYKAPTISCLSPRTAVTIRTPWVAAPSPIKASWVDVSQKAPTRFKLIFADFSKH